MEEWPYQLVVHHLQFTLQAETSVHLGPQAGAQLRGAFWAALQQFACIDPTVRNDPHHQRHCPMCRLFALEVMDGQRGINPARPFAIRPPLPLIMGDDQVFMVGEQFSFGIDLYGDVADLFGYVMQAVYRMGNIGVGYGRGRFTIQQAQAINPLTRTTQELFERGHIIQTPGVPVTQTSVQQAVKLLPTHTLVLRFLTPTEITHNKGQVATRPEFNRLIPRLIERCQALETYYTETPAPTEVWRERHLELSQLSQAISLEKSHTHWVRIESGSRRTTERTSVSGFVGQAEFRGDIQPFLEWIIWGQSLHIGKNAVKGNGWYEIVKEG
ncbi:MAG: CRISPR system precrRNA processing endoribonuclease RAMP protein Cas6 [Chloroflexi bacterium]|nr:CRISPR system precrRNA processing endoribonuclease RAMP protein Cas6 [Chloroflexota bacterium]